ncbi:PLP-dependent aminotransferase family protein [[Kitasatospora] papulosa]|uniref:aminotransferase-like domain-containing protein n=1 Tax=[Kitasatospora] papulosa TaxID=1464011 RepID=UPI0036A0A7C7
MQVGEKQLIRSLGAWRRPGLSLSSALAASIRQAVLDGRLRPGSRLPAERVLAKALGVSRGTVTSALAALRDTGWVHTRHGSASTVCLPLGAPERIAPLSASGLSGSIDLRRAVPAAPSRYYLAAAQRAFAQADPVLAQDGEPGAGLPCLRVFIARHYSSQGLATRPEQILVTSGSRAALALLAAHLRPRVTAVEIPTYFDALHVLRGSGTRLVGCGVSTQGWDIDQLGDAFFAARGGLAYLVPDFHNPTGALMDESTREVVAQLASLHGVSVIVDETLRDLDLREPPQPLSRIRGSILIASASKTVWAGLRVGWIRGPASLVDAMSRHYLFAAVSAAPLQQLTALELISHPEPLLYRRRRELRTQRDHLARLLGDDPRWCFTIPPGGLALWLYLTRHRADVLTDAARAQGLDLAPGPRFAADNTLTHHLRVPYTPPLDTLDRIADVLSALTKH